MQDPPMSNMISLDDARRAGRAVKVRFATGTCQLLVTDAGRHSPSMRASAR